VERERSDRGMTPRSLLQRTLRDGSAATLVLCGALLGTARDRPGAAGAAPGDLQAASPPPSCAEAASGAGRVAGETTGDVGVRLAGEAFFTLVDQAEGKHELRITLTEPQLGRWEIRFSVPGLVGLPAPGDLQVTPADSAGSDSSAATGDLYMFDARALRGRTLLPRSGTLSLDEVDERGICGRFDVFWSGRGGAGLHEVRTRGTFEAVDSGLAGSG
jgi:hypothetical protein